MSIGVERGIEDERAVLQRRGQSLPGMAVPTSRRAVIGSGHTQAAIGTEVRPLHLGAMSEWLANGLPGVTVPYPRGSIGGGSPEPLAVGAKLSGQHIAVVP